MLVSTAPADRYRNRSGADTHFAVLCIALGIESLFQDLKRWWGANNHWQQSRRVLELWMQVRSTGYALMHLLALHLPETFPLATIAPWRKHKPVITAGLFAAWMRQHFFGLAFRHAYDRKSQKFTFPAPRLDPLVQPAPA